MNIICEKVYDMTHLFYMNYRSDNMELSDEMLAELSYVKISKNRTKTIEALKEEIKIPSQIAKDTGIRTNHISNILSELKEHDMVECINPELRKGRLYRLTDKGKEISKNLDRSM